MKQSDLSKDHKDALLEEYGVAQAHINGASARSWQSFGIVAAGTLAGLVYLVIAGTHTLIATVGVTALSIGIIVILELERRIIKREVFFQGLCIQRMLEIEETLGLKRVIYVNVLDEWETKENNKYWKSFSEDEKEHLRHYYADKEGKGAPKLKTRKATYCVIYLLMAGWSALILWEWLAYFVVSSV
jgi:hypothetical protein